jgi:hypothetical protein
MNMEKIRLPIKVITPSAKDWDVPKGGGGSTKLFGEVDDAFRNKLIDEVGEVERYTNLGDPPALPGRQ